MKDLEIPSQTNVHNHHGGFRVEFVDNYIKEVLQRGKLTNCVLLKDDFATRTTDQLGLNVSSITNMGHHES